MAWTVIAPDHGVNPTRSWCVVQKIEIEMWKMNRNHKASYYEECPSEYAANLLLKEKNRRAQGSPN